MPHIHTEPGHIDFTVTAIIIRLDMDEPHALAHLHKKHHILLPVGGHVETHETLWAAIEHEIKEESGYAFDQLQLLQPTVRISHLSQSQEVIHPHAILSNTHAVSDDHFHTDTMYLFTTHETPKEAPSEGESTDLRWLSRREVADLDESQMITITQQTYIAAFDQFLPSWEPLDPTEFSVNKLP